MTGFRVDLGRLELLIEKMSTVEAQLAEVHDDVDSRMRRLQVVWTGCAAAQHELAYREWAPGSREVHQSLARLREIAGTAHGNYTAAVVANRSMWA